MVEKIEENEAVQMRCCKLGLRGWVGGWVSSPPPRAVVLVLLSESPSRAQLLLTDSRCVGGWVGGWVVEKKAV